MDDGVDLSSLQTINFGGGQTGYYDPNESTYYDSGGNELSAGDLSQYGSFTVGAPGAVPPPPSGGGGSVAISGSGSGGALSGLSGLFSGIGSAIVNATRSPTITTPGGGTLVYNPATGGYMTTASQTASAAMTPLLLLLAAGGVIWLIMREA